MAATWCFPAMKMNLRRWLSCKGMVFVCVIWSFDDMGLGEQVILSDKKSKGGQWAMNILNNQIGSIYDRQKNLYSKYPRYSQQNAENKKVCGQEKITATSGKDVLGITKGDKENSYIVHFSDSAMVSRAVARGYVTVNGADVELTEDTKRQLLKVDKEASAAREKAYQDYVMQHEMAVAKQQSEAWRKALDGVPDSLRMLLEINNTENVPEYSEKQKKQYNDAIKAYDHTGNGVSWSQFEWKTYDTQMTVTFEDSVKVESISKNGKLKCIMEPYPGNELDF